MSTIITHRQFPNYHKYEMELAGRPLTLEVGKLAELANAAVMVGYGDTRVLVCATASARPRDGIDFFPLSVDFEEKLYSVGRIPGSFNRREGRPGEKGILTSRVIDRPIRPLFPSDFRNDVSIMATVMSVDHDCSPEIAGLIGTSAALAISDIPWNGPVGAFETDPFGAGTRALAEALAASPAFVVVGGGAVGLETAYWLATEHQRKVTCVEMLEHFEEGACTANRGHLIHYFEAEGGQLINCARVTRFENGHVVIARNRAKAVPDPYCTWAPIIPKNVENPLAPKMTNEEYIEQLEADLVVMAIGNKGDDQPFLSAQQEMVAAEVHNIGDSYNTEKPGNMWQATKAAYNLAIRI